MTTSSLPLLGQSIDPDCRVDAYNACLTELTEDQWRYEAHEINDAIRLVRKDLRLLDPGLQHDLHDLALRFLSFIFSTEDLIVHVSDQMVLSVFKDLVYVFAKAEAKACALAAVVVSLEIVSSKRQNLIKRAALPLVPSLADCIAIRFPGVILVVKEVISAIARLCKVVPDTMHALRCSWAHCVLPIALRFSDSEIQVQAIICLEAVRPSSCAIGKELSKRTVAELDKGELSKLSNMASEVEKAPIVPLIWGICLRCLGIFAFKNLMLWNELASIWKNCFAHGKPDIAIACLESWTVAIESINTCPVKLQDLRLMKLIAKPFMFMFDNNSKKSEYIQVSVRMKATDIWFKFLDVVKCHRSTGRIFKEVICPVMLNMLLSRESAIVIASCNLLGYFFSAPKDALPFASQHSFSCLNSQLVREITSDSDRTQYFNEIFPHFIPVFKALLNRHKLTLDISDLEFGAFKNSWRFFLSNLSQLDLNVVRCVIQELIMCDLNTGQYPIRFQYIECIFAMTPSSIWFGDDHTPIIESPIGRLCERYLAAFADEGQVRSAELRLCEEWPNFTMALSSACLSHQVEQRLVLLSTHFLEPVFKNVRTMSHENAFAFINLARATCVTLCRNAPVKFNVRYFHAICMDLLYSILTSNDLTINRSQLQRFALLLLLSISANESFPVDSVLLKEYEKGLIALLQSCPILKVYTYKFLEQAFGITPHSIPEGVVCSEILRQAIIDSSLSGNPSNSMMQSANKDQEAYDAWRVLYENFDSATEKLLSTPLRSDLRSKVLNGISEQRIYFDGLLAISSELSYTKPR